MILNEPNYSAYDLNFRLFGVQVRVHPMFWLISVLFGADLVNKGQFGLLAIWIACVFVSILVHELGHVMVGRMFGSHGHIVLGFGGLAIGSTQGLRPWQRVAVLLAGPGAGFILYAAAWSARVMLSKQQLPAHVLIAMFFLLRINLWWGMLNLLPVWPLDGGQISGELFSMRQPRNGLRTALQLSVVVGGAVAILTLAEYMGKPLIPYSTGGGIDMALLFGYLAYGSYELHQQLPRDPWENRSSPREEDPSERDADEWKRR